MVMMSLGSLNLVEMVPHKWMMAIVVVDFELVVNMCAEVHSIGMVLFVIEFNCLNMPFLECSVYKY